MKKSIFFSASFCFVLMCMSFVVFAQKATITGIVFDEKNKPVIGVSVSLKGTTIGSVTDINGIYTISNVDTGKCTVVAYMIGYAKVESEVEVAAGQKKEQNFTIKEEVLQLNQVVVVGYGVKEKRDVTGSIETIRHC